jgi:hypothetical protein
VCWAALPWAAVASWRPQLWLGLSLMAGSCHRSSCSFRYHGAWVFLQSAGSSEHVWLCLGISSPLAFQVGSQSVIRWLVSNYPIASSM